MKKNLTTFLIVFLTSITTLSAYESPRKILKVELTGQSQEKIEKFLTLGLDITSYSKTQDYFTVLANETELQQIENLGLKTVILLPDADAFARHLRETGYLNHFHTYDQMLQEMQDIVASYPQIAKLEDIGDSYEKTVDRGGYDIWVMKISDNVEIEEDEPEVFFMANIHAREIITPEIILYFMHYLVDNYGVDPYVTYLVNNRQIWLSPTVNPDGHEYVFTGSNHNNYSDPLWWRKNKRDNNANEIFEPDKDGVDLNRNFGYKWGYDNIGSSPYPSSEVYRGTAPFSEPESQSIRDFVTERNVVITLSFHSHGRWWIFPWGYTRYAPDTPDHAQFVALADSCIAYNGYTPANGDDFDYVVNGDTDDWFYGEQTTKNKIFGFSPEVGNFAESLGGWTGFFPDTMYIEKQIMENQGPMLYLAYAAGEEPIIKPELYHDTVDPIGPYRTNVSIISPIALTQVVELDPSSFKLYYNTTGVAPFDSTNLISTGQLNEYRGAIPGQGEDVTIYYYFSASDLIGRTGYAPQAAPTKLYSFNVGLDSIAPVIVHTPLSNQSIYATSYLVNAKVTDNIEIVKVMLYYRQNGSELDSLVMNTSEIPDEYEVSIIPTVVEVSDLFEYKIEATDVSNNKSVVPPVGFYSFNILEGYVFDFESDDGGFSTNSPSDWQWGIPSSGPFSAHSGSKVWATKLNGDYSNSSNSWLDTPPINLTGITAASLTFWHWYTNEYSSGSLWDGGNVKISVDGSPFEVISPENGYDGIIDPYNSILGNEPAFGGLATNGNYWHKEQFDLSPYVDNTIVIRFHFSSDDNTTEPGWYIDDVEIFIKPTMAPIITNTTILPSTLDNIGPYVVQSNITDDTGITSASLYYRTNTGGSFIEVSLTNVGENIYQGQIPGQPFGTTIDYYIQAMDNDANIAVDPENAPTTTYSFFVTDRAPEIDLLPASFDITLKQRESVTDSILVVNRGLLDLYFTVWDSLLSGTEMSNNESVVPWINEIPDSGIIQGEDSVYVYFMVNGDTVSVGDYHVAIIFSSNDPASPEKLVPLHIKVVLPDGVNEPMTELSIPETFAISQNYPNPFNPDTKINYQLPQTSHVVLQVFNISGQQVRTLIDTQIQPGYHTVVWNGKDDYGKLAPNGVYLFRIETGDFVQAKKMILMR